MKKVVIKVQRSITEPETLLIYTENRKIDQHMPFEGALKIALGNQMKAYFEATLNGDGILGLQRQVKGNW